MIEKIIAYLDQPLIDVAEIIAFGFAFFFIEKLNPADKKAKFFKNDMSNEISIALMNAFIFIPICVFISSMFAVMTLAPLIPHQMFPPKSKACH